MSPQPKLVIDDDDSPSASASSTASSTAIPAIPTKIPSFLASAADSKRSILKSSLRAYEADPVKLTPGLDPSHLSTSPIAEPVVLTQPRVRFASTDQIFQVSAKIVLTRMYT